jgi:hypothetical protein
MMIAVFGFNLNVFIYRSVSAQRFAERTVRNKIEESLNGHLEKKIGLSHEFGNEPRSEISLAQEQTEKYRYMFEMISDRAESK